MLSFVWEQTNLRIAGVYTTKLNSSDTWHPHVRDLWLAGWGVSLFDNEGTQAGKDRSEYERFDEGSQSWTWFSGSTLPFHFPGEAEGVAQAKAIVARATKPGFAPLERAVIYIDNEDISIAGDTNRELNDLTPWVELSTFWKKHRPPNGPLTPPRIRTNQGGFGHVFAFYRALFNYLEQQPPGSVPIRPGLYVHLNVVGQLLVEFPYLHIVDNVYPRGPFNHPLTSLDPDSTQKVDGRLEWRVSKNNAIPISSNRNLMPKAGNLANTWRAWPSVYQYEGTNNAPLFAGSRQYKFGGGTYSIIFTTGTWSMDSESSVVDDPAYPSASPRLAGAGGDSVLIAMNDRLPFIAPVKSPKSRERTGHIQVGTISSNGKGVFNEPGKNTDPGGSAVVEPSIRPRWLVSSGKSVMVTARRASRSLNVSLQSHLLSGGLLKPNAPSLLEAADVLRPHTRWAGAACDDDDAALFVATTDGTLSQTHAKPDAQQWPRLQPVESNIVHPYSRLEAVGRENQDVSAFFIDGERRLHRAWWDPHKKRSDHASAGGQSRTLLPSTAIAAVSPYRQSLVVFAIGFDLCLYVASWNAAAGQWTAPAPVGNQDPRDELLCPHSDLAAIWNKGRMRIEVVAITHDLRICLYSLADTSTRWDADAKRTILFDPVSKTAGQRALPSPGGATPIRDMVEVAPNPYSDLAIALGTKNKPTRVIAADFCSRAGSYMRWTTSDSGQNPPTGARWAP